MYNLPIKDNSILLLFNLAIFSILTELLLLCDLFNILIYKIITVGKSFVGV